jgi:pyruvate formate lyase activating enzyme
MDEGQRLGIINDIQRMSVNDGPGFRTVVFLKGCLLNCEWCHNPEGKRRYPEVIPYVSNCEGCNKCMEVCPTGALKILEEKKPVIDKALCTACFQCIGACKYYALVRWGRIVTAREVMDDVTRDKPFFVESGGGLTVSGGEPLAQPEFSLALMMLAKENGVGTALDTCGHAPWEDLEKVLEYTDLVLFDIKNIDTKEHRRYAGLGNELILDNAKRIAQKGIKMRMRVPIIPGRNDSEESLRATAKFIEGLGDAVLGVDLLPYHPYAGGKYRAFGMDYPFPAGEGLDDDVLAPFVEIFLDYVPEVTVGG